MKDFVKKGFVKKSAAMIVALGLLGCIASAHAAVDQTAAKILMPKDLKWGPPVNNTPQEVSMALILGNPTKPGPFTLRMKMPANFKMDPHKVDVEQNITVLSGSLNMGFGDKYDKNATTKLPTGAFFILPANNVHYLWTDEECVVQITGNGPLKLDFIKKPGETGAVATGGAAGAATTPTAGAEQKKP